MLGLGLGLAASPAKGGGVRRYQAWSHRFAPGAPTGTLASQDQNQFTLKSAPIPEDATEVVFAFAGHGLSHSGTIGSSTQEVTLGATLTYQGFVVSADEGATWNPVTVAGASSFVIPDGANVLSDPFAVAQGATRLLVAYATSGTKYIRTGWCAFNNGERFLTAATSLAGYLANPLSAPESFKGTTTSLVEVPGPVLMLIKRANGPTRSVLILGNSLHQGTGVYDYSADARGNVSYMAMGLDDLTGGQLGYCRMAVPSSFMRDLTAANLTRRKGLLDAAKSLNPDGHEVFDVVSAGDPFNDNYTSAANFTYSLTTQYAQAVAERQGHVQAAIAAVRDMWPSARVVTNTVSAQMTDANATQNRYTDPAQWTVRNALGSDATTGPQWRADYRAWLSSGGSGADGVFDLEEGVSDMTTGKLDVAGAYSGILVNATAAGATSAVVTGLPKVGEILNFGVPGAGNSQLLVTSVVNNGDGTATVSNFGIDRPTLANAHAAGAAVKASWTSDGIHWRLLLAMKGAAAVVSAKLAGVFG